MTLTAIYEKEDGRSKLTLPESVTVGQVQEVLLDVTPSTEIYVIAYGLTRYLCRRSAPYDRERHGERVMHQNVKEIADYGETRRMRCSDCGTEWNEELPQ